MVPITMKAATARIIVDFILALLETRTPASLFAKFDATLGSRFVDDETNRLDHLYVGMRRAIDDCFVRGLLEAGQVDLVLLCQPIVLAAAPGRQRVRVLLESIGKLRTGQSVDIDISLRIRFGLQFRLGIRAGDRGRRDGCGCKQ